MSRLARFVFGGILYWIIEKLYDGTSHPSMAVVGGLSFIIGGEIDELTPKRPWWKQSIIITILILAFEYSAGLLYNKDYRIWDYRKERFNLDGQICLKFALIWYVIFCPLIIVLDNILRWRTYRCG